MKITISGYKKWKHINNELGMFDFYILPSVIVSRDSAFDKKEYPTEIKFAWLFLELSIYLCVWNYDLNKCGDKGVWLKFVFLGPVSYVIILLVL